LEIDEDYIEYSTEICGLSGCGRTIKLTKKDAEEVDRLFENIRLKLNESNTRNEIKRILFNTIVELDKFGLLAGLNVRQAQQLISLEYNDFNLNNEIDKKNNQNPGSFQIEENFNCIFIESLTNCSLFFQNGSLPFFIKALELIYKLNVNHYLAYFLLFNIWLISFLTWSIINQYFLPFTLWPVSLYIGEHQGFLGDYPSEGWIWTYGRNRTVKFKGKMIGDIYRVNWTGTQWGYCGVRDFKGFKIYGNSNPKKIYLLGRASHMRIKSII
jgi:hypothetical protein